MEKSKCSFFLRASKKDDILFQPKLLFNNSEESIKFLGFLWDQHLAWKEYIKLTESKIAKNIGILYKARPYLDKKSVAMALLLIYSLLTKLCKYSMVQY